MSLDGLASMHGCVVGRTPHGRSDTARDGAAHVLEGEILMLSP